MVDDLLTESHLDAINEEYRVRTLEAAKSTGMEISENQILKVSMEQLSYAIATQVTHIDRLSLLHMLSKNRKVAVWTDEKQLTNSDYWQMRRLWVGRIMKLRCLRFLPSQRSI